jgi:ubiquinone/menaquinone biosynthesis C-methylase UbiE
MVKNSSTMDICKRNTDAYCTEEAVKVYTQYVLKPEEVYLFPKYFSKGTSVLDLACGAGRTTVYLHEEGYKVKGVDLSDILIKEAQKRYPNISFEKGSYTDIREAKESYDNILISFNSLDYAYPETERKKALRECVRVMKAGGYLILSSHNIKSLHGSIFYWKHRKRFLLKNIFTAFCPKKYIYESFSHSGLWTFYAAPEYVIQQIESFGFEFKEMVSFRQPFKLIKNKLLNKYLSPYIHYVFRKR